jgi:hypothetical protein
MVFNSSNRTLYYDIQTYSMECEKKATTDLTGNGKLSLTSSELKSNASYKETTDSNQISNTSTVRVAPNEVTLNS